MEEMILIKKFKSLSLTTKATIGFFVVLLIMSLSASIGLVGLLNNNQQFDSFSKLTEESQLTSEFDSHLYEERLCFKKYEADNNIDFVNQYKKIDANMKKDIARFLDITKNKERVNYIFQITSKSNEYQRNFDDYIIVANSITTNYKELTGFGDGLINSLNSMKETSLKTNNLQNYSDILKATTHLLEARLEASRYNNYHIQKEYDLYVTNFNLFQDDVKLLKGIEKNSAYRSEYYNLVNYVSKYNDHMKLLSQDIVKLDHIKFQMDLIGPEISALTTKVKASTLDEVNTFKARLLASNKRSSLFIFVIFIIAIIIGTIVNRSTLRLVIAPINYLKDTFESIAESDANIDFRLSETSNDEIGKMSRAFNVFMLKLKEMVEVLNYQNMLKSAENNIAEIARLEDDINIISNKIVNYLCKNFNMLIGAIYTPNEEGIFQLSGSYAYTNKKGVGGTVEAGEGVIGQVIKEKKMYIINKLPEDYILVQSGLGDAKPNSILVIPCLNEGEVEGIIELASFDDFQTKQINMLEALSDVIGRILASVKIRYQMKVLLDKTIVQAETLMVQQEELRQNNEELEQQTRELKDSEEKLQLQQEELRSTNEELEVHAKELEEQKHVLNERNAALISIQKEMIQKAEALEKANKYKSEFLANMSHELRTPLNSILVLSQLLASKKSDEPLTDKEKEFASTIYSSGNDLLTLINDILDLSKVEAGKVQVHNEKVYLKEILKENKNIFESMANMKKLDFHLSVEDGIPEYIVTDSLRLNQILKNLISNSIKFTNEGYVNVQFRKLKDEESKTFMIYSEDCICIEVSDTGVGIPKDKQRDVFEPFVQVDGTTSRQYGGTGLGLSISLELAKLLGGNIFLESELNKGSKFLLVMPINPVTDERELETIRAFEVNNICAVSDESKNESIQQEDETIIPKFPKVKEKKILIIEDDRTFAQILSDLAEEKGYIVTKAYTGKEGIEKAKSDKPNGIILDIGLPDMDGKILAKMLSEDKMTKNIPIHVISGSEEINEGSGFANMPKNIIGFLKKPVDIKSIYKTLSKIESIDATGTKKILVVGTCGDEDFLQFTQLGQVEINKVLTGKEAIEELKTHTYGCIILDIKLSDTDGIDFMMNLRLELNIHTPIIIYTDEQINSEEVDDISKYAETIILKSPKSKERLVDEVSLFLHNVERSGSNNDTADNTLVENKNTLGGVRVLLADDDNRNVFALTQLLEQNGMEVIAAKNGVDAVKRFEENDVDIVLMDIMMPKMDGYEAIKQIRELKKGMNVPIIALTAKAMSDDKDKCISAGANDYLTKPVDIGRLLSMIKVWMS